ncbi:MAG: PEP/pyruvate-binding domain-containing protein [Actinomycetota bacterium]|nr:PEP/pyruvate-binding domain-containing protein [Actinomycetota bacterium]
MSAEFIVWFDDYVDTDRGRVGGKVASLGELIAAELPVPPGYAVTTAAYENLKEDQDVNREIRATLADVDYTRPVELREISKRVRGLIESIPIPLEVDSHIRESYAKLCEACGVEDVPVAVRSSATAEDLPDASFAGQLDTYLWITGADNVVDNISRCWSSMFTDRAISYRHETGHDHELISMSVAIQKMVQPRAAGVAFTLNPSDGDRSQIAIDSSWGFGEGVVSGEVTPDNFLVDKVIMEIVSRTISPKHMEYALVDGAVEAIDIEPSRQIEPSLTDEEIKDVAAMAKRAERHYGSPQDVEWAIDHQLPDGDSVILLQSRPETVWSRMTRKTVASGMGGMADIVSTLLSPIHSREKSETVEQDPK